MFSLDNLYLYILFYYIDVFKFSALLFFLNLIEDIIFLSFLEYIFQFR